MKHEKLSYSFILSFFLLISICLNAQITTNADGTTSTQYTAGPQDDIFIFCTDEGLNVSSLTATFSTGAGANYEWLKYNNSTSSFEAFQNDNNGAASSTISNLSNGAYRVNVTSGGNTETYTAWVFNNWYSVTAELSDSNCDYFQLNGSFSQATLEYTDLGTGNTLQVFKDIETRWEADGSTIATVISPRIFSPPPRDTEYRLVVSDQFDCESEASVFYTSIVTKANFTVNFKQGMTNESGEAPLEVAFTNESENADSFEWFFFRDLVEIKREAEETGTTVDSIMYIDYGENPIYTFEKSGTYQVKLVTTKTSEFGCTDTFYFENYLIADTSFIDAPNVFTPNGDGVNDEFIVKYWSVRDIKINIFNRWGKKVHEWEKSDVRGFENTYIESAWNGKIGGRYASPGVYYYVVEATGRDDRKRWANGFVHLFREK